MFKIVAVSSIVLSQAAFATVENDPLTPKEIELSSVEGSKSQRKAPPSVKAAFAPFTGKVVGEKVRVRLQPDLDGYIIQEFNKNEMVSVIAQEGNFYCVEPSENFRAYIFRSFVLDGVVEGNRVNVRLEPDLEAPVIGHVSSGDRVDGVVSESNRKWLEIRPPANTKFYVAKEFIEYAGGPELKAKIAKRKETVEQLLEAASLFAKAEMEHDFEEIDFDRIKEGYLSIIHEYNDFPKKTELAKEALSTVQEEYLQKRIAYLEEKAALVTSPKKGKTGRSTSQVKMWAPIEEGLYATWASNNENRAIDEFYEDQKMASVTVTGVLEAFKSPVSNRPGDFIIKHKNLPVAYVYSTKVDLEDYVGKNVTLVGAPRDNNNFAFPAYFVLEVE